jgi:hypothetical protein
LIYFVI